MKYDDIMTTTGCTGLDGLKTQSIPDHFEKQWSIFVFEGFLSRLYLLSIECLFPEKFLRSLF